MADQLSSVATFRFRDNSGMGAFVTYGDNGFLGGMLGYRGLVEAAFLF
jgi:hypothetical protein